jgi:hypothetical protein
MVLVMHKVADYAKWKMAYDGDDSNRLANGLHSYVIGRGVDDSNMVFIAMKSDDLTKAKGFASSPTVKAAMKKGGVMGMPKLMFVTTTFQDTAKIDSRLRSMVSISFKNWDTWQRSFDSTKEIRTNNGLADRVVAKVPNDSTKAVLVMAVLDTAKAFAYWKSDQLKEIRKAGGIMGMPERFNFIVVQRY